MLRTTFISDDFIRDAPSNLRRAIERRSHRPRHRDGPFGLRGRAEVPATVGSSANAIQGIQVRRQRKGRDTCDRLQQLVARLR